MIKFKGRLRLENFIPNLSSIGNSNKVGVCSPDKKKQLLIVSMFFSANLSKLRILNLSKFLLRLTMSDT